MQLYETFLLCVQVCVHMYVGVHVCICTCMCIHVVSGVIPQYTSTFFEFIKMEYFTGQVLTKYTGMVNQKAPKDSLISASTELEF